MRIWNVLSAITLGLMSNAVFAEVSEPVSVMSFDFPKESWQQSQVDGYRFYPANDLGCGAYHLYQDKLCDDEKRMFMYFGNVEKYVQDWVRYGIFQPEYDYSISGNALKLTYTGGYDKGSDGVFRQHGKEIYSLSDYENALTGDVHEMYAGIPLQGQPSIYVKSKDNNATTLNQFSGTNRFAVHVWYPASEDRHMRYSREVDRVNAPLKTSAFYPFLNSSKGGHAYHHATNRAYGSWIKVQYDARPTHYNTGSYNETHSFVEGGLESPGDSVGYFEKIAAYAVRFHEPRARMSPYTMITDDWIAYHAKYENEETLASLGVGYDPEDGAFDVSLEDKYRCSICSGIYEVRYSFSAITNENFNDAYEFTKIENFFMEDDNADNHIIKPNPHFNQVWAKAFLPAADVARVESGEKIYFAVKDLTDRTGVPNSSRDYMLAMTASGQLKPMKDLIKTISYTFRPSPGSNLVALPEKIHLDQQRDTRIPIEKRSDDFTSRLNVTGDASLRSYEVISNGDSSLFLDPILQGQFKLNLKGFGADGKVLTQNALSVDVGGSYCDDDPTCYYYTIADFTKGVMDVRYTEWRDAFKDEQTGFTGAGFSALPGTELHDNVQGIKGPGKRFREGDLVVINIKNTDTVNKWVAPFISKYSEQSMRKPADTLWHGLYRKFVKAGEMESWLVPAQLMLNREGFVSRIGVSLKESDVKLLSLGYYTKDLMRCNTCGRLLVDFNDGGPFHTAPVRGWNHTMQGVYVGHVGDGVGIVVGSNNNYAFAGIAGEYSLRSLTRTVYLHWDNYSDAAVTFTPMFSVYDPDTPLYGEPGEWFDVGAITVLPGQKYVQEVPLPGGEFFMFNVNLNHQSNRVISLDKITR